MAPTKPRSPASQTPNSTASASPSSSAASCGISKPGPGRRKNHWTSSRRRKAVRLYLFTTMNKDEIGKVLGGGFCKSDNERRIRELFLKDEVSSRSTWCKQNGAGHQRSIERWAIFEQYRVQPWRTTQSRHLISTLPHNPKAGIQDTRPELAAAAESNSEASQQPGINWKLQRREEVHDAINRVHTLGSKYLPGHLSSIARVYCHSVTSSVRTSWVSLTSTFRSSRASSVCIEVQTNDNPRSDQESTATTRTWHRRSLGFPSKQILTREEQSVWDIMIDDDQFIEEEGCIDIERNSADARRAKLWAASRSRKLKPLISSFLSLQDRPCNYHVHDTISTGRVGLQSSNCLLCGCSALQHMVHRTQTDERQENRSGLNRTDFYHNTSLFYYATNPYWTVRGLKILIEAGANIMMQNSSGASFLHCLTWGRLGHECPRLTRMSSDQLKSRYTAFCDELIDLLEFLAVREFPFSHRDEHGGTVAHLIFQHMHSEDFELRVEQLDRMLTALNTDLDAVDNQGNCVGQYLDIQDRSRWTRSDVDDYENLLAKVSRSSSLNSSNLMLDFKQLFMSAHGRGKSWPVIVETLGYALMLDSKGDSPLIAMLKVWDIQTDIKDRFRYVEELLKLGTAIDMKDRRGNTALLIATRRGFRSTVEQLLNHGANPNVVNYSNKSVMFMAKGWLKISKRLKDDQQYAWIASCIPVIQDAHAVFSPSIHRQQLSVETRSKYAKGQLQIPDNV